MVNWRTLSKIAVAAVLAMSAYVPVTPVTDRKTWKPLTWVEPLRQTRSISDGEAADAVKPDAVPTTEKRA